MYIYKILYKKSYNRIICNKVETAQVSTEELPVTLSVEYYSAIKRNELLG